MDVVGMQAFKMIPLDENSHNGIKTNKIKHIKNSYDIIILFCFSIYLKIHSGLRMSPNTE
jgi:hypothetical protein